MHQMQAKGLLRFAYPLQEIFVFPKLELVTELRNPIMSSMRLINGYKMVVNMGVGRNYPGGVGFKC